MSTEDDTVEKVAEKFGGTWERLENRFLIGAGDKYKVNATGGSTTNTHYHYTLTSYDGTSVYVTTTSKAPASRVVTSSSGVSLSSNLVSKGTLRQDATYNSTISILNPYTAVYMYKRTA
jgi:shikimate kinase